MRFRSVVLPAPRKPVSMVTGTIFSGRVARLILDLSCFPATPDGAKISLRLHHRGRVRANLARPAITSTAKAPQFGLMARQPEARKRHFVGEAPGQARVAQLCNRAATRAHDQQIMGLSPGIMASRPGVDGVEAVNQAFFHEDVERAVNRWRRRALLPD